MTEDATENIRNKIDLLRSSQDLELVLVLVPEKTAAHIAEQQITGVFYPDGPLDELKAIVELLDGVVGRDNGIQFGNETDDGAGPAVGLDLLGRWCWSAGKDKTKNGKRKETNHTSSIMAQTS